MTSVTSGLTTPIIKQKINMSFKLSTIAALFFVSNAYATGKPPVVTPPPATPPTVVTPDVVVKPNLAAELDSSQVSKLIAEQRAAAEAAAKAKANGTGVGTGTSSVTDASQTNVEGSRALGLSLQLPQPIQLAAMAGVSCPTPQIEQQSNYWLWGANSNAKATTNTDACVLINGYSFYLSMCQFGNANTLLGTLMSNRLPGFTPTIVEMPNLTPQECMEFKNPKPIPVEPKIVYVDRIVETIVEKSVPAVCPKPPVAVRSNKPKQPAQVCK